ASHRALGEHGAFGERARLLEQAVDEGGLAVVDVGDDGDVAEAFDGHDGNGQGAPELEGRARPSKWREPGSIPCCGAANAPAGERLNPLLQPAYRPGIPTPNEAPTMSLNAVFDTDRGPIKVELYPDKAPLTVANFVN